MHTSLGIRVTQENCPGKAAGEKKKKKKKKKALPCVMGSVSGQELAKSVASICPGPLTYVASEVT
jgi:hypothetical protein